MVMPAFPSSPALEVEMPSPRTRRVLQSRAMYARTNGNMLIAGSYSSGPGVDPSGQPPIVWWTGLDSGGGAYPIGPNGPFAYGNGEALPVVTRASALITGPLSAAPFRVLEAGFGGQPLPRPRWVTDPMLTRPDDRFADVWPAVVKLARSVFWSEWVRCALWWGVGAFVTQLDTYGAPLAGSLRLVDSRLLSTERDEQGVLRWALDDSTDRAVFSRDGYLTVGGVTYRLVVLRNPHSPVDVEGRSKGVFELSPTAFGLAGQIDSYASGTFRSGVPAGYLKVETPGLQQQQADDLRAKWLEHHGGDRRSIAVLNATTSFQPLSLSPVDAALAEVKRLNVADVAFAFGLDPLTLGVTLGNSATYSNVSQAWINHRDFGLAPWIAAVEDTLTALLPGAQTVRVDLDGFANPPPAERFAAYKTAIDAGVLTVDECREREGLEPLPKAPAPPVPVPPPVEVDQPAVPAAERHLRIQPWRR